MLTQFFDSFKGIPEGDFDTSHWIGKTGACTIKHEDYNGEKKAKVGYFIPAEKQADLPAWVNEGPSNFITSAVEPEDELPF